MAPWLTVVAFACFGSLLEGQNISPDAAASCRQKIQVVRSGGLASTAGDASPITFSEQEADSYLALDLAGNFPKGLTSVDLQFQQGKVVGTAQVDFDELKKSTSRSLPPLAEYILYGQHEIRVVGALSGQGGQGQFNVETVLLDGVTMPQFLFDILVETFLRRRYPDLRLNGPFELPYAMDSLTVQPGQIRVAGTSTPAR